MFLLNGIKHHFGYLTLLTFFLTISSNAAGSGAYLDQLHDNAKHQQLWKHIEWLNLLHYKGHGDSPGDYRSPIRDKSFFLSESGSNNPEAELTATLTALYDSEKKDDENAQCRFVARRNWLIQKLAIDTATLPGVQCHKYLSWRKHVQPQQVTLVFPTYHLNSPSSMFGHTLLRLDPEKDQGESKWLSVSVSFGANVPEGENSMLYAWRGLAGGYPGTFVTDHYFKKIQEYNKIEHRDIWEYRLNLTPDETERMVTHIWELQKVNFDYYFFDENCSYRLLELLEVARPGIELTDRYIITAIPIDTVKTIEEAGMIESTEYRPARATLLSYMLNSMPEDNRILVLQLSQDIKTKDSNNFKSLSLDNQREVIETSYKYLRYQQAENGRDPVIAKRSYELLKLRNTYPVSKDPEVPAPASPENGHNSKRTTLGLGQRLNNNYAEFGFKMAFHDLEDDKDGFLEGAQINIGNVQIRAEENVGLRLYELDFVDIFSLTPRDKFFKPLSWKVLTGFQRELTNGKDQLVYQLSGGAGGTWEYVKDHMFYTLATGRLEINPQLKNFLEPAIGFNSGFLSHFKHTTARLSFSGEQFEDGVYRLRVEYIQNFVLSTNHSIRFYAKHQWQDDDTEFSDINLKYQYYF